MLEKVGLDLEGLDKKEWRLSSENSAEGPWIWALVHTDHEKGPNLLGVLIIQKKQ